MQIRMNWRIFFLFPSWLVIYFSFSYTSVCKVYSCLSLSLSLSHNLSFSLMFVCVYGLNGIFCWPAINIKNLFFLFLSLECLVGLTVLNFHKSRALFMYFAVGLKLFFPSCFLLVKELMFKMSRFANRNC